MKCDELKFERLGDANETYPASTLVIRKQFVDAAIAELKAKLESVQATAYTDSVDVGMRERRLRRALYKACFNWAHFAVAFFAEYKTKEKWRKMESKCIAKAEEYK